jgi:hypothetical protein
MITPSSIFANTILYIFVNLMGFHNVVLLLVRSNYVVPLLDRLILERQARFNLQPIGCIFDHFTSYRL